MTKRELDDLLRDEEVAKILDVSTKTVARYHAKGLMGHVQPPGTRWKRTKYRQVLAFVESFTHEPGERELTQVRRRSRTRRVSVEVKEDMSDLTLAYEYLQAQSKSRQSDCARRKPGNDLS
jgi:DNA-binding transcriptional MerR regulator